MRNPIKNFRQCFIVFEKPVKFSEKLKILTNSNCYRVEQFFGE